jgi:hypothetical protein
MSIPTFGGMLIQTMTMFVVPVLQCWWREHAIRHNGENADGAERVISTPSLSTQNDKQ